MSDSSPSNPVNLTAIRGRLKQAAGVQGHRPFAIGSYVADIQDMLGEIDRLTARVAELTKERDDWARKADEWRGKYAELRFPGMKGVVHTAGAADETSDG